MRNLIGDMIKRKDVILFGAGLASGVLIVFAAQSVIDHSDQVALFEDAGELDASLVQQPGNQPTSTNDESGSVGSISDVQASKPKLSPRAVVTNEPVEDASGSTGPPGSGAAASLPLPADLAEQPQARIPEPYASMVEPNPLPEKLTVQEMFEGFSTDERDEAWAYPMELGINQHIARRGGELETTFEFVECRSRYCTIAGVVYDGGQSTVNVLLGEMTQSGWWQTFGGASTVGSNQGSEYRFVSIFPREESDASREESAPQL